MKQKLVALLLIIVMVASALTAVGLTTTTTVAAATTTQTTLEVSPTKKPNVGQSVTFTATLMNGTKLLSSKPVTIYHYLNGVKYTDTTKTTNAYGKITFAQTFSSDGKRTYYATFAGDSKYAKSTSTVVPVEVQKVLTKTTLTASTTSPPINLQVTFTATLKRLNPATNSYVPLVGKSVTIYHYLNGVKYTDTTKTTNAYGKITFAQTFSSAGPRTYYATFAGDSKYAKSTNTVEKIEVRHYSTTLSLSSNHDKPAVAQSVTLTATLKNGTTPLSGKPVTIYHYLDGVRYNDITKTTDVNGQITFAQSFDSPSQRTYYATFDDGTYWGASSAVKSVTWMYQPQLSLGVSKDTPKIGETVTFSGYLTDQSGFHPGGPLADKQVTIYWRYKDTSGWHVGMQTQTDESGHYSFYISYDQKQAFEYYASWAGDSTHWDASSTPIVTVTWA